MKKREKEKDLSLHVDCLCTLSTLLYILPDAVLFACFAGEPKEKVVKPNEVKKAKIETTAVSSKSQGVQQDFLCSLLDLSKADPSFVIPESFDGTRAKYRSQ